ncbi:hypothetical protein AB3Y40_10240 [Yoonia sp. R2331]|uniref:hypothetical protein n=1 Tax=Yoonia sp. R2331 TaxID=3237238 RepID=UPI0034E3E1E7
MTADAVSTAMISGMDWRLVFDDLIGSSPNQKLWPDGMPIQHLKAWNQAVKVLNAKVEDWQFLVNFYERLLAGRDVLANPIAQVLEKISDDDWRKGPEHINPKFDEVLALYRADDEQAVIDATPVGETVEFDGEAQVLVLRPTDQIPDDHLENIVAQIAAARRVLDGPGGLGNAYQSLSDELRLLEQAETIYRDRPVLILRIVSQVLKRLAHKFGNGECPSPGQDTNIYDFQDRLKVVQFELVALNDQVRNYHEAMRPEVVESAVPSIVEAASVVAQASNTDLAKALEEEAGRLNDSTLDSVSRSNALLRILGLIVRGGKAVRTALKVSADTLKDVVVIGGATNAGLAWYFGPAYWEFVKAALKGLGL